jgi:hypothetical protein
MEYEKRTNGLAMDEVNIDQGKMMYSETKDVDRLLAADFRPLAQH